jgi:hypothetical protein
MISAMRVPVVVTRWPAIRMALPRLAVPALKLKPLKPGGGISCAFTDATSNAGAGPVWPAAASGSRSAEHAVKIRVISPLPFSLRFAYQVVGGRAV